MTALVFAGCDFSPSFLGLFAFLDVVRRSRDACWLTFSTGSAYDSDTSSVALRVAFLFLSWNTLPLSLGISALSLSRSVSCSLISVAWWLSARSLAWSMLTILSSGLTS